MERDVRLPGAIKLHTRIIKIWFRANPTLTASAAQMKPASL